MLLCAAKVKLLEKFTLGRWKISWPHGRGQWFIVENEHH